VRRGATAALLAGCLATALALGGCTDDEDEPESSPGPTEQTTSPVYDPSLEPAAAVMALVPEEATRLAVTDFDQIRLQLGNPDLSPTAPPRVRAEFWTRVDEETAALTRGLLRDDEDELREEYGFSQDDVLWEAQFGDDTGVTGWVLRFGDDVDMGEVQRAVDDEVGPLGGVQVAAEQRVIGTGTTTSLDASWAADPELTSLVGRPAASTYVERGCIGFEDVFGEGTLDQLAAAPSEDVAELTDLTSYAVSFGGDLATARLGPARSDTFARSRLADTLPETEPSFGEGLQRPVADPAGGRIGYALGDVRVAVELTMTRQLPFAVCAP
jgi:hypothetical protein